MRRVFAILLILLVPLQFAWSATQSLHGHLNSDVSGLGFHSHDGNHDHHGHSERSAHQESLAGSSGGGSSDDGYSGGHYHPIFISILVDVELMLAEASPGGPPIRPLATFTSRIPPLFDWPPSVRC